jgi:hypothetical protein
LKRVGFEVCVGGLKNKSGGRGRFVDGAISKGDVEGLVGCGELVLQGKVLMDERDGGS